MKQLASTHRMPKVKVAEPKFGRSLMVLISLLALVVLALAQSNTPAGSPRGEIGMAIPWPLFVIVMLIVMALNGTAVAAETATELLRPVHVKHMKDKNERHAVRLQTLLDNRPTF